MTENRTRTKTKSTGIVTVEFQDIEHEGVYVSQRGDMFRIPPEAIADGHSPLLQWETDDSNLVTRVSADPYTPISKCRQLAADCDLPVRF
jgi:hypothetical protein